jgi:Tol biopolymer transport system component
MNTLMKYMAIILSSFVLSMGCSDNGTEPEPQAIPLDGRGGGVIFYCYQPLQNGIHQIYGINADGSGNKKIIDAAIGLNHHDISPDATQFACVGYMDAGFNTWSIHTFNADGTGLTRLTTTSNVEDSEPAWSPDGSQISFTRIYPNQNGREELWIMNADGSNQHYIGVEGFAAKWSSDGLRFVYSANISDNYDIYTCKVDGTDIQQLTSTPVNEWFTVWSPDDSFIAFNAYPTGDYSASEIYIMEANGNNLTRLTDNTTSDGYPRFSPDGSLISFTHDLSSQQWEIFIMNTDGSNVRQVTDSPSGITAINAVWRP